MNSTLVELTDAMAGDMVPVPGDAEDVCPICRSWRETGYGLCRNCHQAVEELTSPCTRVLPVCLYAKPSRMRDRLTYYKDGDDAERAKYAPEVASILERFFAENDSRLVNVTGGWDSACVVPSESRVPPHPLELALSAWPATHVPNREVLLERHVGRLGHRALSDDAFRTLIDVAGRRVLLLDDVYTTGARSQSAASALSIAGAQVVAIVVIARRINPTFMPGVQALWDRQVTIPFSFTDAPWWAVVRRKSSQAPGA